MGNDKELIRASLDGQPEAYGRLVQRYEGPLVGYLTGLLRNPDEALDVAQEAFVRSFMALGRFKTTAPFAPWLFGIAHNVVKERRRARRREQPLPFVEPAAPDALAERAVSDEAVRSAIAQLPERYRQVILLRYYAQMSCAEVAEALEVPLGTVTKRLSRAYAIMRKTIPSQEANT